MKTTLLILGFTAILFAFWFLNFYIPTEPNRKIIESQQLIITNQGIIRQNLEETRRIELEIKDADKARDTILSNERQILHMLRHKKTCR